MPKKILLILFFITVFFSMTFNATASRGIKVKVRTDKTLATQESQEVTIYSKSHALVVGIDDYNNGWPRLSSAVNDAKRIAKELSKKKFAVTTVINPGSDELTKAFKEFFIFKGEKKEDRLFVWFAGHGHTEDGEGYIIPKDAPLPAKGAAFRYKALSMRRFGEYVRQAKSKHVYTVFDSCFSGTIFSTQRSAPPAAITRSALLPVRQFLSSGDANQTVSDNGLFCKLFIRALRDEEAADANKDGYLTGSELGMFLTDRITNLSEASQTPRYGKLRDPDYDQGDYVFLLPGKDIIEKKEAIKKPATGFARAYNPETEMWNTVKDSENPKDFEDFIKSFPESQLIPAAKVKLRRLLADNEAAITSPYIKTLKKSYNRGDPVVVQFANLPGNQGDWFTIIRQNKPDTTYGPYDYTYGSKSGHYTFKSPEPGLYEVRLYLDWPNGGYTVHSRYSFSVK